MILADIVSLLNDSWLAGVMLLVLAGSFALVLLIASIKLKVEIDPKIEQTIEALPGIDCGACGFAGCSSYAKAVVANPDLLGKCAPGGTKAAERIAEILSLKASGSNTPSRPIVHCKATTEDKTFYGKYEGIPSCTSANALSNVQGCKYGCLGFGDCVSACKFGAINIVNGLATIDYSKCTGCTACVKACPRGIIEMVPFVYDKMLTVACRSAESGKDTKKFCKVGCIGCKLCTKQSDAFEMNGNYARLNYEKYDKSEAFETAAAKCPTKVIIYRGKDIE